MITLTTLPHATAQEVFEQVATHLLTQKEKSIEPYDGACVYRGPDGLKCAAGCLIADDEYLDGMEGNSWEDLVYGDTIPFEISDNHLGLIYALQGLHDNLYPEEWSNALRGIEIEYGFTWQDHG